jgi:hypothetical protein
MPEPRPRKFILDTLEVHLQDPSPEVANPPFTVSARKPQLTFYPCSQCHSYWQTNPEPRKLAPVHEVGLQHGTGQLWCLDCHARDDRDHLRSQWDDPIDFDDSWRVCRRCHLSRQQDWYFGVHGKRVYSWQGEAERYSCTHCHDPHRPRFAQRKPQVKPNIRAGLPAVKLLREDVLPLWERLDSRSGGKEE